MDAPFNRETPPEWRQIVHHRISVGQHETVEQAYEKMLAAGAYFAAAVNEDNVPVGIVSLHKLAATMSAKYGQTIFAKKPLKDSRVQGVVFGSITNPDPTKSMSLITPLHLAVVIDPNLDFFTAQSFVERRPEEHSLDDIIMITKSGIFSGLIPMRAFMKLQMEMLRSQESELRRCHEEIKQVLHQLTQTQAELLNSTKMAALGELVAGIAHELNTPIGVMISSHDMIEKVFDLLKKEQTPERTAQLNHYLRTHVEIGREASVRVDQIVRSLRVFGRDDQQEQTTASLADLITSTLVLLDGKLKPAVTIHANMVEAANVRCFPGQITQVLVNVLTNASEAMDGQGSIHIGLQRGLTFWEISIRDSGPGIPPHLFERIFDPGFTTKGGGVERGLGLSIAKAILEKSHGGGITASNDPNGGAVFRIEIPLLHPRPEHPAESTSEALPPLS